MKTAIANFLILTAFSFLYAVSTHAAQPISNGDFETGSTAGWRNDSTKGAVVKVVSRNGCFSSGDTTQISIRGQYASLLRSGSNGPSSTAKLTSPAFTAGDGVAFIALTENVAGLKKPPVSFNVEILDASNDTVIVSHKIDTSKTILTQGCPGNGKAAPFGSHYISTRAYTGSGIKIRFVQHTNVKGSNFFTLIDQVILFNQGEQPIFYSRPHPQAGIRETSWGTPYLDSTGSFDPDNASRKLDYSWYIDSNEVRQHKKPCVADLEDGNHIAVVYVNDGQNALSDVIHFVIDVPDDMRSDFTVQTPSNPFASINPVAQDPECSTSLPEYEVEINSPNVDVNDHLDIENEDDADDADDADDDNDAANSATNSATISAQFRTTSSRSNAPSVASSTNTALNSNIQDIRSSGIRWKPVSERNGNLVVLTPSSFPETTAMLINSNGTTIEIGVSSGRTNGDRVTYRFNRTGSAYPSNIILRIGSTDYSVPDPGADIR